MAEEKTVIQIDTTKMTLAEARELMNNLKKQFSVKLYYDENTGEVIRADKLGEGVKFEHDYKDEANENFLFLKNEFKD